MAAPKKFNSKELTQHLRQLAMEAHDVDVDSEGNTSVITKGEAIVRLMYKKALGYTEEVRDDEGRVQKIVHKPEKWALEMVYDRLEGKAPASSAVEEDTRTKASEKVRELAVARINALAPVEAPKGPPPLKRK